MLAPPGAPILLSPKSALIAEFSIWDDAPDHKLTDQPKQFTVLEDTTLASSIAGSAHMRTKQEQLDGPSENPAQQIEAWLVRPQEENAWLSSRGMEGQPEHLEASWNDKKMFSSPIADIRQPAVSVASGLAAGLGASPALPLPLLC
ncbi:hypothetical protein [Ruegeria atlantica]|uniref:hypothetical protein n=1 Tax=Ruegeria atlantica TaxID=81569 RepID=UPI0024948F01|nr:hypothetical protein [Ruegeria atlantica]